MDPAGNPWLRVPAADYEAHMDAVGQSMALRALFADVYQARRPSRLAVLGCTTGSDLLQVDPAVTAVAVGVDLNPAYLAVARERLGARVRLVAGNVLSVALPDAPFDLVHAALLLEYVDPAALFARIHGWLSPGGACSVVTQEPTPGVAPVTRSGYESLQLLDGQMTLHHAGEVAAIAERAGLRLLGARPATLPGGKRLVSSLFEKRVPP